MAAGLAASLLWRSAAADQGAGTAVLGFLTVVVKDTDAFAAQAEATQAMRSAVAALLDVEAATVEVPSITADATLEGTARVSFSATVKQGSAGEEDEAGSAMDDLMALSPEEVNSRVRAACAAVWGAASPVEGVASVAACEGGACRTLDAAEGILPPTDAVVVVPAAGSSGLERYGGRAVLLLAGLLGAACLLVCIMATRQSFSEAFKKVSEEVFPPDMMTCSSSTSVACTLARAKRGKSTATSSVFTDSVSSSSPFSTPSGNRVGKLAPLSEVPPSKSAREAPQEPPALPPPPRAPAAAALPSASAGAWQTVAPSQEVGPTAAERPLEPPGGQPPCRQMVCGRQQAPRPHGCCPDSPRSPQLPPLPPPEGAPPAAAFAAAAAAGVADAAAAEPRPPTLAARLDGPRPPGALGQHHHAFEAVQTVQRRGNVTLDMNTGEVRLRRELRFHDPADLAAAAAEPAEFEDLAAAHEVLADAAALAAALGAPVRVESHATAAAAAAGNAGEAAAAAAAAAEGRRLPQRRAARAAELLRLLGADAAGLHVESAGEARDREASVLIKLDLQRCSTASARRPAEIFRHVQDVQRRGKLHMDLNTGDVKLGRALSFASSSGGGGGETGEGGAGAFRDDEAAEAALRDLAELSRTLRALLVVEGHAQAASWDGSASPLSLADRRAEATARRLVALGADPARVRSTAVVCHGEAKLAIYFDMRSCDPGPGAERRACGRAERGWKPQAAQGEAPAAAAAAAGGGALEPPSGGSNSGVSTRSCEDPALAPRGAPEGRGFGSSSECPSSASSAAGAAEGSGNPLGFPAALEPRQPWQVVAPCA